MAVVHCFCAAGLAGKAAAAEAAARAAAANIGGGSQTVRGSGGSYSGSDGTGSESEPKFTLSRGSGWLLSEDDSDDEWVPRAAERPCWTAALTAADCAGSASSWRGGLCAAGCATSLVTSLYICQQLPFPARNKQYLCVSCRTHVRQRRFGFWRVADLVLAKETKSCCGGSMYTR